MDKVTEEPLQELDVNSVQEGRSSEDYLSAAKTCYSAALLARIDALQCGSSCTVASGGSEERYVVLEADWYEFRAHLDRLPGLLARVTRTANGTGLLVLRVGLQNSREPASWHWLRLRLRRLVCAEELCILSSHLLSADSRSIVLPRVTSAELQREIRRNASLLTHHRSELEGLQAAPTAPPPPMPMPAAPRLTRSAALPQTQELLLTKAEVTYLIGPAGDRIEATRLQSQATIKVLPICRSPSAAEQCRRRSLRQTLAVTGSRHQIATALALLEAQLNLHRQAPNHQV